jgi:hypothetical protein
MLRKSRITFILILIVINFHCIPLVWNPINQREKEQKFSDNYNNLKLSAQEINITTPENITYTEPMSGYFPATFGFENDDIGGDAQEWDDSASDTNCGSQVVAEKNGHYNVIEIYDNNGGAKARLDNYFEDQTYGTVELWVIPSDATNGGIIRLMDHDLAENRAYLRLVNDHWNTYDGFVDTIIPNVPDPQDNVWQHVRIDFESTSGGYQGLSQYTYEVTIDGISSGSIPFYTNGGAIDRFNIFTGNAETATRWIDAVGYSWEPNYNIGENFNEGLLLSFVNTTSLEWIGYSLDDQVNRTILGNTTFNIPENGLHKIQVFGNNSLGTIFQSNISYFSVEYISIDINTPENIIYTEPMSGYYPATFGFENDANGADPFGWTVNELGDNPINVVSTIDGHNKVVEIDHVDSDDRPSVNNIFSVNQSYGTIEFWWRIEDATDRADVWVMEPLSIGYYSVVLSIQNDKFRRYYSPGFQWFDIGKIASDNTWYHIRIDFECSNGGYSGLSEGQWQVFIDRERFGSYPMVGTHNQLYLESIQFLAYDGYSGYSAYFDAIGYSWNPNYNIGDNLNEGLLLSYTNTSDLEWMGYSLDGQVNKTIFGNTVIPMPENGVHSIIIYGRSTSEYYYESDLVYFIVNIDQEPTPPNDENENLMLVFILIGIFTLLGIAIAFVVYRKVHVPSVEPKHRNQKARKAKPKKTAILPEELFCPFCQYPIEIDQKFCRFCGSNIKEEKET